VADDSRSVVMVADTCKSATLISEMMIEPVTKTHMTNDAMIRTILSQMNALEPRRKYMFIAWLHAHNSQMKKATNLQEGLRVWFDSMHSANAQWEYRLITIEIAWWHDQSDRKLDLLIMEHFAEREL
jgi:hypothetical protein